jgi:hypothetical protein
MAFDGHFGSGPLVLVRLIKASNIVKAIKIDASLARKPTLKGQKMDEKLAKELRQIRNALLLIALKLGATTDEVGRATGIGANNVSTIIPQRVRGKRKTKKD